MARLGRPGEGRKCLEPQGCPAGTGLLATNHCSEQKGQIWRHRGCPNMSPPPPSLLKMPSLISKPYLGLREQPTVCGQWPLLTPKPPYSSGARETPDTGYGSRVQPQRPQEGILFSHQAARTRARHCLVLLTAGLGGRFLTEGPVLHMQTPSKDARTGDWACSLSPATCRIITQTSAQAHGE